MLLSGFQERPLIKVTYLSLCCNIIVAVSYTVILFLRIFELIIRLNSVNFKCQVIVRAELELTIL